MSRRENFGMMSLAPITAYGRLERALINSEPKNALDAPFNDGCGIDNRWAQGIRCA
jgi:hypothetical protein